MKNYYEILEVNKNASIDVIKRAYKVLIDRYKPDNFYGEERIYAEKKTNELNEAYHVLSDYFLREQYNLELEKEESVKYNMKNSKSNVNNNQVKKINNNDNSQNRKNDKKENNKKPEIGSFGAIIALMKEIFGFWKKKNISTKSEKKFDKTTWIAIGLTIIVVLLIGVILWFIPFTKPWIKELLFIQ